MQVKIGRRNINIRARRLSKIGMIKGLMFCPTNTETLLFDFGHDARHAIHSYFVFFTFLAVWLDEKNNVVDKFKVRPFTTLRMPNVKCRKLIEIPCNDNNEKIIEFFVEKRKN